jgi:tRNA(Ile)-lysidine synthase
LLNVSRAEIESYLTTLGQRWREDDSNLDSKFLRNRLRHELLPLLEREYNPNLRQVLSEIAEVARAEEEYWHVLVERESCSQSATPSTLALSRFPQLPLAVQRRLLKQFAKANGLAADFEHIENLLRCAIGEIGGTELPGGWMVVREGEYLSLWPPTTRINLDAALSYRYTLPVPGEVAIPELGLSLRAVLLSADCANQAEVGTLLAADLLPQELTVRNWQPGDRYLPAHSRSERKLKRLFSEKEIPDDRRPTWPVVLKDDEIVWVRGFAVGLSCEWKGQGSALLIEEVR